MRLNLQPPFCDAGAPPAQCELRVLASVLLILGILLPGGGFNKWLSLSPYIYIHNYIYVYILSD